MVRRLWTQGVGSYDERGRELAAASFADRGAAHQELIQRLQVALPPLFSPMWLGSSGYRKTYPLGMSTNEIRQRKLAARQPLETADPFNRYYRLGADRGQSNLILQNFVPGRDPEISTNVHWSYGGWEKVYGTYLAVPSGLTAEKQRKYFEARDDTPPRRGSLDVYNGSTIPLNRGEQHDRTRNALKTSLRFSSNMTDMYRVFGSPHDTDFNMIGSLDSLWDSLDDGRGGQRTFDNPELLAQLPYGRDELIIDEAVTTFTHIFKIQPRVLAMLARVGWTVEEFERRYHELHPRRWAVDFNRNYSSQQARNMFRRLRRGFFNGSPEDRDGTLARSLGRRMWARLRRGGSGYGQGGLAGLFLALYGPEDYRGDEEWSRHREWSRYQPEYTSRITGLDVYRTIEAWLTENEREESGVKDAILQDMLARDLTNRGMGNQGYGPHHDYEYYDFLIEVPFVRDAATEQVGTFPGYQQAFSASILQGAFIDPEYNFYNPTYEQAIAHPNISELILPNMYMYQLATPSTPSRSESRRHPWDSSAGREQQGAFDRLVRLDEFIDTIIPLQSDSDLREEYETEAQINDYLSSFGKVLEGTPEIAIELGGSVANEYYNTVTNASHMNIYDEFNGYKNNFPMYIEIGIPLAPVGGFSEVFSDWISSTGIVNSFLDTTPRRARTGTPFRFETRAIEQYNYGQGPQARNAFARLKENVKVYDYDDWKRNLVSEVNKIYFNRASQIGTLPGISPQWVNSLLHTATNWVNNYAASRKRLYFHYLYGLLRDCHSETIMYKLTKIKVTEDPQDRNRDQEEILQNFYFPNIDPGSGEAEAGRFGEGERLTNILKFVDTQVKYEQSYRYELRGYEVVYGSTFRFRRRDKIVPVNKNEENPYQNKVLYSFNVETLPNVKIVEYPILTNKWESSTRGRVVTNRTAFGGVSYPTVRVQDKPPVPPNVSIKPYKDEPNKVLVMLAPGLGNYAGQSSKPYVPFNKEERQQYEQIRRYQSTQENYSLPPGHLEFKNEGVREIKEMLVYRIDSIDTEVESKTELYTKNFTDVEPIRRLNINPDAPPSDSAQSYDMTDTIQPNKKYYYTFRSVDFHDKKSFPTEIYEVELISDKGLNVPSIRLFDPPLKDSEKSSKKLARFLEISTADIQALPIEETNESAELVMAKRSVVDARSENGVAANKFVIRLTSQDTGRKIDLVLNFNVNETVAEEE